MERIVFSLSIVVGAFLDMISYRGFSFFIYRKENLNYVLVSIKAPTLIAMEKVREKDKGFEFSLSFDTNFLIINTKFMKSLELRVLGFGFNIVRQRGC